MTQGGLHEVNRRTVVQSVGSVRVGEPVRADRLGDPRPFCGAAQNHANPAAIEASSAA